MTAGPRIAIAAPHTLAVDAAREIVGEGGNAVDAAVAAAAALTVVYPHNCLSARNHKRPAGDAQQRWFRGSLRSHLNHRVSERR